MIFLLFKLLIRKYMYSESKINSKFDFGLTVIRVFLQMLFSYRMLLLSFHRLPCAYI